MAVHYPDYIQRGGEICFNGPSRYDEVTLYGFILEVSNPALRSMADRYLNQPSRGEFKFSPHVDLLLVTFVRIEKTVSLHGLDHSTGTLAYNELGLWTFLDSTRGMRAFSPYMWVDSPITMVSGREICGFPKSLGKIRIPDEPARNPEFSVHASSVAIYGRTNQFRELPVLQIRCPEPFEYRLEEEWTQDGACALRHIAARYKEVTKKSASSTPTDLSRLASAIVNARIAWVFLKQIRGVAVAGRACYQALTEASTTVTKFKGGHWMPAEKWEILFHDLDSAPFVREFSLRGGSQPTNRDVPVAKTPAVAFCLRFSFECDLGREIWRAPVPEWSAS